MVKRVKYAVLLAAVFLAAVVIGRILMVQAVRGDVETVHIKDSDVENSSLIIGTHIIYLNALTDEIYELAKQSQSDMNQSSIYYKSELAGGAWFEISSAQSIYDIIDSGTPVAVSVIENLDVRYHTKSDGITYDLLNGQAVCVFDIDNPYDIAANNDLEVVTAQQQLLNEKSSKNDSDDYYLGILNNFINSSVTNSTTAICDSYIGLLNSYYPNVSQDTKKAEILNNIMGRLDSTRRAEVYEKIADKLSDLLDEASLTNQSNKNIQQNTDVTDAITTAMQNIQSSLTGYQQEKINDETIVGNSSDSDSSSGNTGSSQGTTTGGTGGNGSGNGSGTTTGGTGSTGSGDGSGTTTGGTGGTGETGSEDGSGTTTGGTGETGSGDGSGTTTGGTGSTGSGDSSGTTTGGTGSTGSGDSSGTTTGGTGGTGSSGSGDSSGTTTGESGSNQDSESILTKAENGLIKEMIAAISSGSTESIDSVFDKITALNNIENGTTGNAQAEIDFIKDNLLKESVKKAKELISAGVNAEYVAALSAGSSKAGLSEILKQQSSEIDQALEEVLYFEKAAASRMTTSDAKEYLLEELQNADSYMDNVKNDALKPYIQKLIDNYKYNVEEKYLDYASGGTNEMDNLLSDRQTAITEKQKCLDANDLEGAKTWNDEITRLDNNIQVKESELEEIIKSSTATQAQKADAQAQLSSTSVASAINDIKNQALEDLNSGDYSTAADSVSGIEALVSSSPETAKAALKEIFTKLVSDQLMSDAISSEDSGLISDAIESINDVLANNSDVFLGNNLNKSAVLNLVNEIFGNSFSNLDNEQQTAIEQKIQDIGEYLNSSQLLDTAAELAAVMYNSGNPYVFERLKNETKSYISLENLAKCMNYRYVYSDSLKQATLQKDTNYYYFDIFSKTVKKEGDTESEMASATKFQSGLYVPADYVKDVFNYDYTSVTKSDYALIYTDAIDALGEEFEDALLYGIQ